MKKLVLLALVVVVALVSFYIYKIPKPEQNNNGEGNSLSSSVLDLTILLDGEEFKMDNGLATKSLAPESSFLVTLRVFGEPVYADLDKDGDEDAALWLEYAPGGSGTFYYGVLAIKEGDEYKVTDTLFLGDRIAPQSLNVEDGRAVYNFAERRADEPFSTPPSIGRSVYVHYDVKSGRVGEWVKDFEGESNPTERYKGQVDRVAVVFENYDYTSFRLVTNGVVREGEMNTERGYKDDVDATVYVLDWQKHQSEQMKYVRLTKEPGKLYLLNTEGEIVGNPLTIE